MADLYFAPEALRRLPMALLRSQNYPKYPDQTAVAAQQVIDGQAQAQIHMPRSAVYTQWKSTYKGGFGDNVASMLLAMEQGVAQTQQLQKAALGAVPNTYPIHVAAQPFNQIPGPSPTSLNHTPLSRDVQPQETMLTVDRLSDYVKESRAQRVQNAIARSDRKGKAIQAIAARQQYLHDRTIATRATTPWGLVQENS